jgi:four helix bundle protein
MSEGEHNPRRRKVDRRHTDLEVFERAFSAAMRVFELSKAFPAVERYALTDQMRRASRSVAANLAEGWRKRRYPAAFVAKLGDAEGEAAETQVWLQFPVSCGYLAPETARLLYAEYDEIIGMLVRMITRPEDWTL